VRRTLRLVQGIAAVLRFKFLQLSCSNDRTCDIVFAAYWANNAHVVNCGRDLFCIGTADEAVHVSAPLVAIWGDPGLVGPRSRYLKPSARDQEHPRGLVVGRLLDGFDKEIAGAGRWIEKFWLSGMNPSPKPAH
jgi:hypothetical protein